jgi:hypothetical protein
MYAAFHETMVAYLTKGMDSGDAVAARPLGEFDPPVGDATEVLRGAFRSRNLAYSPD